MDELRQRLQSDAPVMYLVRSDSAEEAAAFVCAGMLDESDLAGESVVVTDRNGWRFVEANEAIKIAIAAIPEIVQPPPVERVSSSSFLMRQEQWDQRRVTASKPI